MHNHIICLNSCVTVTKSNNSTRGRMHAIYSRGVAGNKKVGGGGGGGQTPKKTQALVSCIVYQ